MASIKNKKLEVHTDLSPTKILDRLIANYKKSDPSLSFISDHLSKNKSEIITNIKPFIPQENQKLYTFQLTNANTQIANAFRRVLVSELPLFYFNLEYEDIDTDDPKLARTREYIIQRINSIPIDQEAVEKLDLEKNPIRFVLESENLDKSTLSIYDKIVTSGDINLYEKKDSKWIKVDNNQKYFKYCQTIRIAPLKKAKKIRFEINLTNTNSANNHTISRGTLASYKPLEFKEPYPSSFTVHPKSYELGILNNRFTDCKWHVNKIFKNIHDRLKVILSDFQEAEKTGVPYTSEKLTIEKLKGEDDKYKYKLFNETRTTGNLIAWHTYKIDETGFINCGDEHPKDPFIVLIIINKNHLEILKKGTQKAIDEVDKIIKQL